MIQSLLVAIRNAKTYEERVAAAAAFVQEAGITEEMKDAISTATWQARQAQYLASAPRWLKALRLRANRFDGNSREALWRVKWGKQFGGEGTLVAWFDLGSEAQLSLRVGGGGSLDAEVKTPNDVRSLSSALRVLADMIDTDLNRALVEGGFSIMAPLGDP